MSVVRTQASCFRCMFAEQELANHLFSTPPICPRAPEPKRRSRKGCWPCKGRKVKCGEEHPTCANCQRTGEPLPIRIPRSLHPLPSKLRDDSMNLLYFHHFLNHTAKVLVPYDDPKSNPFRTILPQMATEIISPTAFGYNIPWQAHLNLARDLMRKRLAYLRENACNLEEDKICSFLWSWFAYLDVLGSLSGGVPGTNSPGSWVLEYTLFSNADSQHEIDCIMGFTTRCVQLLAQVADLARHCDLQRIRPDTLLPQPNWTPTQNSVQLARQLEGELMESMARPSRPCRHVRNVETRDRQEMVLMNEAFHWAGLVHIHRRVYGKRSGHADVQVPVQRILACMGCIRAGGTAETGFLFPMFVAGCNTQVERQRMGILERLGRVESNGMTQVRKARLLMQKVWETGQPWEPLLSSEFIG
ncbi:hypothetical protein Cob_v009339 [Colletotrichum orbiculare MAFF 240422]|uniref:Zn(2)-C6 fungal-type domain-containing protein n=1 Tax=Colletotrichum orbiculare (strain 104-T / ATCC 96160 / CBS 514.97 / LARS 414 / MAFF 240422) TaxID=1213857 RepID=A0A484FIM3_COLOR|nr:hypothetical protein Cob_v009339 [Colletotrichum orbiculare MAFF 240422]